MPKIKESKSIKKARTDLSLSTEQKIDAAESKESAAAVAKRLRVTARTVRRWRQRLKAAGHRQFAKGERAGMRVARRWLGDSQWETLVKWRGQDPRIWARQNLPGYMVKEGAGKNGWDVDLIAEAVWKLQRSAKERRAALGLKKQRPYSRAQIRAIKAELQEEISG